MDFKPTSDQEQMVHSALRMYVNDIEPILRRHPADQPLPKESAKQILQHFAKLGLTAARLPEDAGWRDAMLSQPLEALAMAVRPYPPADLARKIRYDAARQVVYTPAR